MQRPLLVVFALALVVAACGGADAATTTVPPTEAPTATEAPAASTTTTTVAPVSTPPLTTTTTLPSTTSPLNGVEVTNEALLDRRVVAVKVDNHWDARPQSGLAAADAVYELLVEGGLTRFIALFHQSDSSYLGPNRSGRPTDPTLVAPLDATFVISGAQSWVQSRIRSFDVSLIGEEPPASFRIPERSAPHNLYVDTTLHRELADQRGYDDVAPAPLFSFGQHQGTSTATAVTLEWSDDMDDVTWHFDGSGYLRYNGTSPHREVAQQGAAETTVKAETLVILFADQYSACPSAGQEGSCVPSMDTVGSGRAIVVHNGGAAEGTWSRDDASAPFTLTKDDGETLFVPAGKLWISIFPNGRTVSW
ncbi:MAG: DUF3048 domain-containing protein [Acidimicrobiia bacterium]|nr:DUF3048 domain-containing protein [Acidimicrobiia bacterium]